MGSLDRPAGPAHIRAPDLSVTTLLLKALRDDCAGRGASLWVVAIPSKSELTGRGERPLYRPWIRDICAGLDVPFLDLGVAIANVGTGYFAPESEKELTSLQMMVAHARWLVALVGTAAAS